MSYLVDTNVLSELRRRKPDAGVVRWLEGRPATTLYLSARAIRQAAIQCLPFNTRLNAANIWTPPRTITA